jgi:hypothetical protein
MNEIEREEGAMTATTFKNNSLLPIYTVKNTQTFHASIKAEKG